MTSAFPYPLKPALIVLLVALALCVAASAYMMPYVPDDSYISFRYAEHLAQGHGLTFNVDEPPVEAYSNFLWIALCAWFKSWGYDLPGAMPIIGVIFGVLSVGLLWGLLFRRRMDPLQMLFPMIIFATAGPFIMYTISGLEMPLFASLLLLAILCTDVIFAAGRLVHYVLLAATCVLLAMCRPEGVVVFPAIAFTIGWLTRLKNPSAVNRTRIRNLVIASAVFIGAMGVYHLWRVNYFGELVPTPLISKAGGGESIVSAWVRNIPIYFQKQGEYFPPLGYYIAALMLAGVFGLKRSPSLPAARRTEVTALVVALVLAAIYYNFVDWMPGMRYHAALIGLLLLPAAHVQAPFFCGRKAGVPAGAGFWLIGIIAFLINASAFSDLRIITKRTEVSNQTCLVPLGLWLKDVMPAGSVLAMSDVGAVPFYSGFKTIDIHPQSLTDPHIARHGFSSEYIYQRRPNIVILPSRSINLTKFYPEHFAMAEDVRFQQIYRFLGVSRYDWYNDRCYWIFIPAGLPELSEAQMARFPHGVGTLSRKRK